jgi:hypothetical protein
MAEVRVTSVGSTEQIPFKLFKMPCCNQMLCWVQPRLPAYCPMCGQAVWAQLKSGDCTLRSGAGWLRLECWGPQGPR